MQNNYVTDAINLKSYNLSESDKIIVMYSKEKGLIKGIAKGVSQGAYHATALNGDDTGEGQSIAYGAYQFASEDGDGEKQKEDAASTEQG